RGPGRSRRRDRDRSSPSGCREGGAGRRGTSPGARSEEHTSELQSLAYIVCRLLLEKKKTPGVRDRFGVRIDAAGGSIRCHDLSPRAGEGAASVSVVENSVPRTVPSFPTRRSSDLPRSWTVAQARQGQVVAERMSRRRRWKTRYVSRSQSITPTSVRSVVQHRASPST